MAQGIPPSPDAQPPTYTLRYNYLTYKVLILNRLLYTDILLSPSPKFKLVGSKAVTPSITVYATISRIKFKQVLMNCVWVLTIKYRSGSIFSLPQKTNNWWRLKAMGSEWYLANGLLWKIVFQVNVETSDITQAILCWKCSCLITNASTRRQF